MQEDEVQKRQKLLKLKNLLKELSRYRARHTELISVYIPAGYSIQNVISQLAEETSTARNIKSATTRKNVIAALESMINHLKLYKKTPENGLAVFSGNIAGRPGEWDVRVWSIEPPQPLKMKIYRCDQVFYLEPLKDMLLEKKTYGLIVIDGREANIALLKGKSIVPIKSFKSAVPGKMRAGGQSAARFARVREGLLKDFFKKVGEAVNEEFAKLDLAGILVGGPGPTKEEFVEGPYISTPIKEKIIAIKNLGYTGEYGLRELVDKSEDVLAKEELIEEKKAMRRFLTVLATKPHLAAYGPAEVRAALEIGAVDLLLLHEDLNEKELEDYIELAEKSGAKIQIISTGTPEGEQLKGLGGVAAVLRFAIS